MNFFSHTAIIAHMLFIHRYPPLWVTLYSSAQLSKLINTAE